MKLRLDQLLKFLQIHLRNFLFHQYDLLLQEFQSDKSSKDQSHGISEEKRKEKEELRLKFEKEQEEKLIAKKAIIEARANVKKPVQVGKIDLEKLNEKSLKTELKSSQNEEKINEKNSDSSENINKEKIETNIKTKYKKLSGLKTVGDKIDLNGYYKADENIVNNIMRPSTTLNHIIENI